MLKCGLAGVVVSTLLVGPVQASPVDEIVGNTILSTYPDGRTGELWVQADGTYDGEGRRGEPSSGRWKVSGGKLCLRQSKPMPSFLSFCAGMPANGLRDGWTRKAITGETIRVRLIHGRVMGASGSGGLSEAGHSNGLSAVSTPTRLK